MARTRGGLCCFRSGKPSGDLRRSSAACICCIGPHHRPSGGSSSSSSCVPCLAPNAEHSVRAPLTSCCGSGGGGGGVLGRSNGARTPRTPKTPCTPTARRLCGARPRSTHRGQASAGAAAAVAAASARTPRTPATPIGRSQRSCCGTRGPAPGSAKAGGTTRRRWLRSARQTLAQTPRRAARAVVAGGRGTTPRGNNGNGGADVVKVYSTPLAVAAEEVAKEAESICSNDEYALLCREGFAREDVAAVTIQAYFRAHLARRAFKALRSLVRLQAVARGAYVRRQAEVAVSCMQAMARLQGRVRARRIRARPNEEDKLLLQQS